MLQFISDKSLDTIINTFYYNNGKVEQSLKAISGVLVDTIYFGYNNGNGNEIHVINKDFAAELNYLNNRSIDTSIYYQNKPDGKVFDFYENGQLESEYQILNHRVNGEKIEYYENGRTFSKSYYKNGRLEGIYKEFYENGNISCKINFTDSLENGEQWHYFEDGSLQMNGFAADGELYKFIEYDSLGSKVVVYP